MGDSLVVELREGAGKSRARKLRAAGRIPGVLYGRGRQTVAISLDPLGLERSISASDAGVNTLFDLEVSGNGEFKGRVVMLKELQRDPIYGGLLHADLYEVDLSQTVEVSVPLHVRGSAHGVSMGGILDHSLRELEIECMPRDIPGEIELDVSALDIGDSIHVRDLALPENVTLRTDPDLAVVSVILPAKEEEPTPEEAAEVAEGAEVPEGEEGAPAAEGEAPAEKKESAEKGGE